ncbi:MAG TPA: TfoX/Sxy family protein [Burkholderiaceae bacterium]|nr:TfoX/Sxy family protein [Burkholderiaceae bacterium]
MSLAAALDRAREFADRLQAIGPMSVTRFFGGAGVVKNGVQFAFIIEGVLYLRVDDVSRPEFEAMGAAPFVYSGRSRAVRVAKYYALPDEIADDQEALLRWATRAFHIAEIAKSTARRKISVK